MQVLLSPSQLQLITKRLAHQLTENREDLTEVVFIGIQPRGTRIAEKILHEIKLLHHTASIQYGCLDITFYRDDIREELHLPKETNISFSIENKKVVLIDDVLYTGRTVRAALNALQDFGRPSRVELCVLVDRRFNRELPIQPNYMGISIDTTPQQIVKVNWETEETLIFSS